MAIRHRTKMPKSVPLEEGLLTGWAMAMLCDRMRWGNEKDLSRLARKGTWAWLPLITLHPLDA
jgi:hypothetical protein